VLKGHACVQRCQYHKRKNIESYLPKREQSRIRRKLETAYAKPTYDAARRALDALKPELELTSPPQSGGRHGRDADAASTRTDVDAW
jgi:transposase-like protein